MFMLTKMIYRSNAIPIKPDIFTETKNLKLIQNHKRPQRTKAILNKKDKADLKICWELQ
jgi:hypothetical protein